MMITETTEAAPLIFGLDPLWMASAILLVVYAFIISEKMNRVVVSFLAAAVMGALGLITQVEAVKGIDFNTLGLLVGMMILVGVTKRSGIFQYLAIVTVKSVKGNPRLLLPALSLITAFLSAFLDNVTTVLLIVPIVIVLAERMELKLFPYLLSIIFASNLGGAATLIGDPPNIMIGAAVGLSFMDFVYNVGPAAVTALLFQIVLCDILWGRKMQMTNDHRLFVASLDVRGAIEDRVLLKKALFCFALAILGFTVGHHYGLQAGSVAMTAAILLMCLDQLGHRPAVQSERTHHAFSTVEWETIFFFIGLFIVIAAVEKAGVLDLLAHQLLALTGGDLLITGLVILWGAAILSAFVDNIPFVATMIPLIKAMAPAMGGEAALLPLWWCLSLGACLGGNGTIIGASANVVVAGFAERAGQRISFIEYMRYAFPMMLVTLVVATVFMYFFALTP